MSDHRRAKSGLAVSALVSTIAASLVAGRPDDAGAQVKVPGAVPRPASRGRRFNSGQPTPYPISTLGPLGPPNELQYPAYGTPVPGINAGVPAPDLPAAVTLVQAVAIGFDRSPTLAAARADVAVQAAAVRLQRAGLLPNVALSAAYDFEHLQPGGFATSSLGGTSAGTTGITGAGGTPGIGTGIGTTPGTGTGTTPGTGTGIGTTPGTGTGTTPGTGTGTGTTPGTGTGTTPGTGTGTGTTPGTGTTTGTGTSGLLGSRALTSYNSASFRLAVTQLIYDGGRTAAAINAAKRSETAFADTYRRDLQVVANNVAQAYYAYLAARRTTQVDLELVRQNQVQVDLVSAQVRAGTTARADIATVELPLAQARLAVVRSQGNELTAEATFENAMGLDANIDVQPVDDAPIFTNNAISLVPIPTYAEAVRRAIALRPDYDSSIQTIRQSEYSLRAASLGRYPTLSASASAADASTDRYVGAFRNTQTVGLALSVPLYDQGITAANVASSRATLSIARAQLSSALLNLQLGVKQSLAGLVSARASLVQTQQEYTTAVTNVRATQAQYRAGVTTLPLLLNAQVQLTQALTDQVTAVYALRESEQAYLYQIGANDVVFIGDHPLAARPTPDPQPTKTAPPRNPNATPLPIPSQPVNPLPTPEPTGTAQPTPMPSPALTPAPARRGRRGGAA